MAVLTTQSRNALPTGQFALPAQRAYPIPDPSHARDALARASQFANPAEREAIMAKVHQQFPQIQIQQARVAALRRR